MHPNEFQILGKYLPDSSHDYIRQLIDGEHLLIRITKPRKTRYGSFTAKKQSGRKTINISGQQNKWAFLITFLHEFAHLKVWKQYSNTVRSHGNEWKNTFRELSAPLISIAVFPEDIAVELKSYLNGKKASESSDTKLLRVLKRYDEENNGQVFIENVTVGQVFYFQNRQFQILEKLRTRYKCREIKTGRVFVFSPLVEVNPVKS